MQNNESLHQQYGADLDQAERWPYPLRIYLLRVLWRIVYYTLWKICWKRSPMRPLLLRVFGARTSLHVSIPGSVWIEMPFDLAIGQWVTIGTEATLYNLGGLTIGDYTVISQNAYICGGTHDFTDPTFPLVRRPIRIGHHVWIAAGAFIGPGITIGDGAVVGACAVVTKDVEPWTVVAGNPARIIKRREMKSTKPDAVHDSTVSS